MQAMTVPGDINSVKSIIEYVLEAGKKAHLGKKATYRLRLAVEELATNIIMHGYQDAGIQGDITIRADMDEKTLRIQLEDRGAPFDPREHAKPESLDKNLEEREIGGLGVYLALESVDEYYYEYSDGCNISSIFILRPANSTTNPLITTKTQQVDTLISRFMLDVARVNSHAHKLSDLLKSIVSEVGARGFQLTADIQTPIHQLEKSLKDSQDNSQRIIDQLSQFQKLLDVSGIIFSSLELDEVLGKVMDTVIHITGAERAYLMLRQHEDDEFTVHAARNVLGRDLDDEGLIFSHRIIEQTVEEAKPIITIDARTDSRFYDTQSVMKHDLRSILSIPLMIRGQIIGLLYADNSIKEGTFSEELVPLLTIFATQAATAIENARLFEKTRLDARLERDLQIGQEIQAGFLPTTIPQVEGWQLDAYFHPARQVAGDFYDAFSVSHDKIAFVVGDVCDKGIGAALFMALFRSLLRAFAQQHRSLSWMDNMISGEHRRTSVQERRTLLSTGAIAMKDAIVLTNDYIATNHGDSNMFATIFFGMIDPGNGALTYINAGHNPPILVGADGTYKERLAVTGPAVGMMPNMDFEISQSRLEPGDTLMCFTDGLTEAKNPVGGFFGEAHLTEILQTNAHRPVNQIVATVRSAVFEHIQTASQFDDITLLAIQRHT